MLPVKIGTLDNMFDKGWAIMKRIKLPVMIMVSMATFSGYINGAIGKDGNMEKIKLPEPNYKGIVSVEEAIQQRRSERNFTGRALTMDQLSQMTWCAQGVTDAAGRKRSAPSAGATYPLDLYVVVGEKTCADLAAGVYRYLPGEHAIILHLAGDRRKPLAAAALGQDFIARAPLSLVLTANYLRTTGRYGKRGARYVYMEAGHVGENVHLQAKAMGLGTCMVGAFDDSEVSSTLSLPAEHEPLYIMPVGYPK
jgi:SagB-type dehydrogenase family enzyme